MIKHIIFNSIFRNIYVLSFIIAIALWISTGILIKRHNPDNIVIVDLTVEEIKYAENEE